MYIRVKAVPSSKKELFVKQSEDIFLINVKEPAERNLANKRIIFLVAGYFEVLSNNVRIISGHRSRNKILSVDIE